MPCGNDEDSCGNGGVTLFYRTYKDMGKMELTKLFQVFWSLLLVIVDHLAYDTSREHLHVAE